MPPGKDNPVGNSGKFDLAGQSQTGGILQALGTRANARGIAQGNARAIIESARIKAATELTLKQMEIQAAAEATQAEHERAIKLARQKNNHEIKVAKVENEQKRLNQTQSTVHTHGVLDRMITDFPDADLDFTTERGQSVRITRPKGAPSEDSEGGSSF